MPLSLSGTHCYQLPKETRVNFNVGDTQPKPGDVYASSSLAPIRREVWVEKRAICSSPPIPRGTNYAPQAQQLFIFNEYVALNRHALQQGLQELKTLRDNYWSQLGATSSIAGCLTSAASAAATGAYKGSLLGPKGAVIGFVVGGSINMAEVVRRGWNNDKTGETLDFMTNVIDVFQQICAGALTQEQLLKRMVELKCISERIGPAACAAMAEFVLRLENYDHPSFRALMSDYHVACTRMTLTESRS